MTIISVDVRGELRVDGEPKKVADLTQEFWRNSWTTHSNLRSNTK